MLTIPLRNRAHFCDGLSRRNFLRIGGLAVGGLTLADLLRADESSATDRRHKSVIMVFLPGGPSHVDTVDPKPQAPAEVRGPFQPIATSVPGVQFSEHLPRLAQRMERLAVIRTIVGGPDDHASHMCLTGWDRQGPQPVGRWPTFGSVVSKLRGPVDPAVPPYVSLAAPMIHPPYNDPGPGLLGLPQAAFCPDEAGRGQLTLAGLTVEQLADRRALRTSFDGLHGDLDSSDSLAGMESFYEQAFRMISRPAVRDALDVSQEDPRVLERYGPGTPELIPEFNAAPRLTQQFLMARRLVEAGARVVTVAFGAYDWHKDNFHGHEGQLPYLDQALSALIDDLHERGLERDVAVCAWGEFGRSPRINKDVGRDHWPAVSCALLAGGGFRTGQALGATTRWGDQASDRPVHFREVLATLYAHLGIDPAHLLVHDLANRPAHLLGDYGPIPELS